MSHKLENLHSISMSWVHFLAIQNIQLMGPTLNMLSFSVITKKKKKILKILDSKIMSNSFPL